MARPLDPANLEYAKEDIELLANMHAHFLASGYLQDLVDLLEKSARYLAIHSEPIDRDDIYRSSDLLPLDILNPPAAGQPLHGCDRCKRNLSAKCFVIERRGRSIKRLSVCKACNLADVRETLPARKEELKVGHPAYSASPNIST